jgi:hypothetical protein
LKHPEVELERDSWLLFGGGRLIGYGLVWDDSSGERIDMDLPPAPCLLMPDRSARAEDTQAAP